MKLATTTGDFFKYGLDDAGSALAVREAGFRYIDYSFDYDYNHGTGLLGDNWQAFADELLELADKNGYKYVQAHSPLGKPLVFDEAHDRFVAATRRSIESAAYLGIKNIVVHSGYRPHLTKKESFRLNKEFYEELLDVADKFDINILTENFEKMYDKECYWADSAEDVLELTEYINHPRLKICWDIGHGNMLETPPHEVLPMIKGHLAALHVQSNSGFSDDHIMPFMGTINMDSVMHGLLAAGYNGYFTFECNGTLGNWRRRKFEADTRCLVYPLEFAKRFESIMYDMGKYVLIQYDCFEE